MAGTAVRIHESKRRGGPGLFPHTSSARSRAWNAGGDVSSAQAGPCLREGKRERFDPDGAIAHVLPPKHRSWRLKRLPQGSNLKPSHRRPMGSPHRWRTLD